MIQRLIATRKGQVAGLLQAAEVQGFDGKTLTLGFDQAHQPLRERCEGLQAAVIEQALSDLADRDISCRYVSTGRRGTPPPAAKPLQQLTAEEKNQINQDPVIESIRTLFNGDIVDMRILQPPAEEAQPEAAETGAAPGNFEEEDTDDLEDDDGDE